MTTQEDRSKKHILSDIEINSLTEQRLDLAQVQYSNLNRKSINDLRNQEVYDVPSLISVLTTNNENNRETALKALGEAGGDLAIAAIEITLLKKSDDRWIAKKAAANSLKVCSLLSVEGTPLINPLAVGKEFIKLHVVYRPQKRADLKVIRLRDYKAAINIKTVKPFDIHSLELQVRGNLDQQALIKKARHAGLAVTEAESRVRIMGNTWPGMGRTNPSLSLTFSSPKKGVISVISDTIPIDAAEYWSACIRVLTRYAKWAC